MTQGVSANFAPHFAPSPAFVAQWIEQRFPKPQVAGPIPAEGARYVWPAGCMSHAAVLRGTRKGSEILGITDTV